MSVGKLRDLERFIEDRRLGKPGRPEGGTAPTPREYIQELLQRYANARPLPALERPPVAPETLTAGQRDFLAHLDARHREVALHPERFCALPWQMDSFPATSEGSGRFGLYPSRRLIRSLLVRELRKLIAQRRGQYIVREENEGVLDYLVGYLCEPERHHPGLIISAGVGTGKTTLTRALLNLLGQSPRAVERRNGGGHPPAHLIDADQLALGYSPDDFAARNGPLYRIWTSELLIIDDLGLEPLVAKHFGTEFRPVEMLIGMRYNRMLPTIISTNLTRGEIEARYGSRLFDRLNELFQFIYMSQESFRPAIGGRYGQ